MSVIKDINFKENNNWNQLLDLIYPIGSIYISINNTNPGTLFGGTWNQLKDRFLLSADSTYIAGSTGGEAIHTLTPAETALKQHNHALDHTHADTLAFSVAQHASTNCTRSRGAAVSDHPVTACNRTTDITVSIGNHSISTQPAFKYTPCAAHTHSMSTAYLCLSANGGLNYWNYYFNRKGSGVTAWNAEWWFSGDSSTSESWSNEDDATTISGTTDSTNHTGTKNGTEVASSGAKVSDHVPSVTQPTLRTPKLTHPASTITQPTFNIPALAHGTPTKSGSITDYSGNTGTLTEADGAPHNNMPPYLVVYMWERTA